MQLLGEGKQLQAGQTGTAFERISDGGRAYERGDIIRLAVKPHLVGRILFFSVNQVRPLPVLSVYLSQTFSP
jgi:hypothetical protein